MLDFCIIGSGISGSKIAELLSKKYSIAVYDKARGAGGRSSNKKFKKNLSFDHGLQYFSLKNNIFEKDLKKLINKKILKIWDGNHLDFTFNKNPNSMKVIGKKGNNDLIKYNLKGIKQNFNSTVTKIKKKQNFWEISLNGNTQIQSKNLILTCPYPQVKILAKRYLSEKMINLNVIMQPNITVMLVFKNQENKFISSMRFNDKMLAWAANENSKKRFKSKLNLWTLQSSLKWSKKNINKYKKDKKIINQLILRFLDLTGFKKNKIIFKKAHGWKYSYNFKSSNLDSYWDKKFKIGICGDWFQGPKAENAWASAISLFKKINKKT